MVERRVKALEESANFLAAEVIAADIAADLEAALEQFATIAEDLKGGVDIRPAAHFDDFRSTVSFFDLKSSGEVEQKRVQLAGGRELQVPLVFGVDG
ncbi:MAG: hypothetical protein JHC85_12535, partial [Chthoniobacterales bacterium]|nr:hypothetical protein [Chthoniobacterales bacterium]